MTDKERINELEKELNYLKKAIAYSQLQSSKEQQNKILGTGMLQFKPNARAVEALEKVQVEMNTNNSLQDMPHSIYVCLWDIIDQLIKEYGGKNE